MVNFFYILDTIRCNAITLYAIKQKKNLPKGNSLDIGWELVLNLVRPQIEARPRIGLNKSLVAKMSSFIEIENGLAPTAVPDAAAATFPCIAGTKKHCVLCLDECSGQGCKEKKDKFSKVKSRCQKCDIAVCDKHSKLVCYNHF